MRTHQETERAVLQALDLAESGEPAVPAIIKLGAGWIAEEALAIGIFCAAAANSLEEGVILAVNHSGDSDSTGAIAGNLLGAIYGVEAIPDRWLNKLELVSVIRRIAGDLHDHPTWDEQRLLAMAADYPGV